MNKTKPTDLFILKHNESWNINALAMMFSVRLKNIFFIKF